LRRVFLVTVDGWGTNLLGCYGNSLCETPHLDSLAARSRVFDRCWTPSLDLKEVLASIVFGCRSLPNSNSIPPLAHSYGRGVGGEGSPLESLNAPVETARHANIAEALRIAGKRSLFISDDTSLKEVEWLTAFDEVRFYPGDSLGDDTSLPIDWKETQAAFFVEAALGDLAEQCDSPDRAPDLVWMHCSGLSRHWDAPLEYRRRLCDPEIDPEPSTTRQPIQLLIDESTDPDAIFQAACVAAAQGTVIDNIVDWIETSIAALFNREDCLLILLGTRGYPLGEHRSVGFARPRPYVESVHVPLIIRSGYPPLGNRVPDPVQPAMLQDFIMQWFNEQVATQPGDPSSSSDLCYAPQQINFVDSNEALAIAVGRWSMVAKSEIFEQASEIEINDDRLGVFLSPDDRWQQNNVASRVGEVTKALIALAAAHRTRIHDGWTANEMAPLDPCLLRRV
jgi:hypothetical protein